MVHKKHMGDLPHRTARLRESWEPPLFYCALVVNFLFKKRHLGPTTLLSGNKVNSVLTKSDLDAIGSLMELALSYVVIIYGLFIHPGKD